MGFQLSPRIVWEVVYSLDMVQCGERVMLPGNFEQGEF